MKKRFDLSNQTFFAEIMLFLAELFFLRATIVVMAFLFLGSNRTTARAAFHQAKKSKMVFSDFLLPSSFAHNFLYFIKKLL
ncbi:MAG: hypothetical protein A3A44_00515 [Candidatus Sungbacteria bacterium RIFCSPLOWO2_01_FULL_60_25]|uniref:Uncharacterized protein n=1 Tax=Candidatus Sungbacteria bacterium RIFCSPLOWO2_01_FULL_60_25 TaxID=1802281 RepID=A0A1G2L9N5_9BACT|nr:MAG: hypothetical protein A3A44_00515 [Candidatus Sungbacteria bacterium RIFCSPLOWO2_01_FULL_60_25]